jgi:alcohol dehydrogenase class IV
MSGVRTFALSRAEGVLQGTGAVGRIGAVLDDRGRRRALLVTGRSVGTGAPFAQLRDELGGRVAAVFDRVQAHNPAERVAELIDLARQADADVIIGIGGGSAVDAAKLAALGVCAGIHGPEGLARHAATVDFGSPLAAEPLPILAVPTMLSAAEWNGIAAFVRDEPHAKLLLRHDELTPSLVVLDPVFCRQTPRELWASTGARAVDHAVETIYSTTAHPYSSSLALGALRLLARDLPTSWRDADEDQAALDCLLAGWMSVAASFNVVTGLSHAIGHQLGALGVPHGVTSCITLPVVMRHLEPATGPAQAQIAGALAGGMGDDPAPGGAADRVAHLFGELGVPRRLRDTVVTRDQLSTVAAATMTEGAAIVAAAPLAIDEATITSLLQEMW